MGLYPVSYVMLITVKCGYRPLTAPKDISKDLIFKY